MTSDLVLALEKTEFHDDKEYCARGHHFAAGKVQNRFMTVRESYPAVVGEMAQYLYDKFYTNATPAGGGGAFLNDPILRVEFQARLSAANTGTGSRSEGWRVIDKQGGRLLLSGPDWQDMWVDPADFTPTAGDVGVAKLPPSLTLRQASFFHALGNRDQPPNAPHQEVRVYFNVSRSGAVPLMRAVTRELNEGGVAFRYKTISDPQQYTRADNAVLYLARDEWELARPRLAAVWQQAHFWLRRETPRFTKRLAAGMGLAESVGAGESFGMSRSRIVAEAAWTAFSTGVETEEGRLEVAIRHFKENGVDPDRPYLEEGHDDIY